MGRIGKFIKDASRRRVFANAALYVVAAWVAIQVAGMAIDAGLLRLALRDVFVATFLGFPAALVISWFYDFTRRGLVRTPPVGADASFDRSLRRRDYLLFASLAAVWTVAIVVVHTPAPVDKSIAILPFENRGQDPDNAMFAFGIRTDLHTQLQSLRDLKIIASESTDRIDSDMSLPEIGLKLGAAYIMKGSVERVLDAVRINVVLIDAEKEEQSWIRSYDRELTASNWFDIRNEITGLVTEALQTRLSPAEQEKLETTPTENMVALEMYFRGQQRMAKRTSGALAEAVDYFQQAVELDPKYALAWVGLADSLHLRMLYSGLPRDIETPKVKAAIDKALQLDDQLGEAYAILGLVQDREGDLIASEASFKRALELNPNYATAHFWYSSLLSETSREEQALARVRKARELSPLSPVINVHMGNELEGLGRFDEALALYESVIEIDPAFPHPYWRITEIHRSAFGRIDQALVWMRKAIEVDPGNPSGVAVVGWIYLELGDLQNAEDWINRSLELSEESFWPNATKAYLHLHRDEDVKGLEYARKGLTIDSRPNIILAYLAHHALREGRYAEARALYEGSFPGLLNDDEPTIDTNNFRQAIDVAYVLSKVGEQKRANLLLGRSLTFIRTIPRAGWPDGFWIADVRIYALQGKTDKALAALRQAIDDGWRVYWWYYLEHDPVLDSIRDEPEFQTMADEIKADIATQLKRVRVMEANGELAPIPDSN